MILDSDYRLLSPAEVMSLHNGLAMFVVRKVEKIKMTEKPPTNQNGKFSQIGKRPKGKKL